MTTLDQILTLKYKQMVDLGSIQNTGNDTTIVGSSTITSDVYISGQAILYGTVSIGSSLYILGSTTIVGNVSVGNSLTVLGDSIMNNITLLSNIYISNNSNINGNLLISGNGIFNSNVTMSGSLNISGYTQFLNGVNVSNIQSINNNPLNINGNIINIGNANSIVNIIGTSNFVTSTQLNLEEKKIILNLNASTGSGFDIGNLSGIEILGTSGTGYIRSDITATRFEIKPPIGNSGYIATLDINNNLFISGLSTIQNNVTILTSLFVSGNTNINNDLTINNILLVTGNTIIQGVVSINSNLFVSSNTLIQGMTSINSNLYVNNNSFFNNAVTANSNLLTSGNTIINNSTTINSSLFVSGNALFQGNTTINGSLYISGNSLLVGNTTILNSLYVSGNTILNNSVTINSNLYVSQSTLLYSSASFNSNLNVLGNSILTNDITAGTTLSYFNLSGQIITTLHDYPDCESAITGGVPMWGFYRSGDIIKIRLSMTQPIVYITGNTNITNYSGLPYYDQGAKAIDSLGNINSVYMISLLSGTSNLLSNNILISGTSTLLYQTINLINGSYTAMYQATDLFGNTGYNYRTINLISQPSSLIVNSSLPILTFNNTNSLLFYIGTPIIDPGVIAVNSTGSRLSVYMINLSLGSDKLLTNNLLTSNILITGTTTVIFNSLPIGTYTATYVATDANNNVGIGYKTINVIVIPGPTITLIGGTSATAYLNIVFTDPGVTAVNYLGNNITLIYMTSLIASGNTTNLLSSNILITGTKTTIIPIINTLPLGSYIATYQVTDSLGNISYSYRTINIVTIPPVLIINYNSSNIQLSSTNKVYFNSPDLYQEFYSQWSIKPSFLASNNINYNNNWCVIFKGTVLGLGPGHYAQFNFDSVWNGTDSKPNGNYNNLGNPLKTLTYNHQSYYFDTNLCSFIINNTYYFILSNNNSTLNIQVFNNNIQILNSNTLNPHTYQQTVNLFEIYMEDTWRFTKGLLLSPVNNIIPQDFINIYNNIF